MAGMVPIDLSKLFVDYESEIRCQAELSNPKLTVEQANELDREDAASNTGLQCNGSRRHKAVTPCFQLVGPHLPNID